MKAMRLSLGMALLVAGAAPPVARAATPPRILIIYDMEGVSGISREEMTSYSDPADYAEGRRFLTADVNAAIRGLKDGGAGAIWVQDGHGSGNGDGPDLLVDQMDARAQYDFRERDYDPYSTGLDGSLDAIVCIAMHARAGDRGFLAHTYTLEPAFRVNGVDITETQIIALSAARWGVPVIMASGDDVLGEQLRDALPDVEYAEVKKASSLARAEPVAPAEVTRRIETAAKRAIEKFVAGRFRPYSVGAPVTFELSFQNAAQASRASSDRAVELSGERTVRYVAPSFVEGYERSKHLISLASGDRLALLVRLLNQSEDGKKVLADYRRLVLQRWLEPDRLPEWARNQPAPPKPTRYYGDR